MEILKKKISQDFLFGSISLIPNINPLNHFSLFFCRNNKEESKFAYLRHQTRPSCIYHCFFCLHSNPIKATSLINVHQKTSQQRRYKPLFYFSGAFEDNQINKAYNGF